MVTTLHADFGSLAGEDSLELCSRGAALSFSLRATAAADKKLKKKVELRVPFLELLQPLGTAVVGGDTATAGAAAAAAAASKASASRANGIGFTMENGSAEIFAATMQSGEAAAREENEGEGKTPSSLASRKVTLLPVYLSGGRTTVAAAVLRTANLALVPASAEDPRRLAFLGTLELSTTRGSMDSDDMEVSKVK